MILHDAIIVAGSVLLLFWFIVLNLLVTVLAADWTDARRAARRGKGGAS